MLPEPPRPMGRHVRMLSRSILFLLVFFSALAVWTAPARAETLRLVTLESPPLEYSREGRVMGINVEIVREALRRTGRAATVELVPWRRALEMVRGGQADGIIDAGYTPERGTYLHFPLENIYLEEIFAFKPASADLALEESLDNVGNYRVGVVRGSFYGARMDSALRRELFKEVQAARDVESLARMLLAGRVDMFLGVRMAVEDILRRMGADDRVGLVPQAGTRQPLILDYSPTYVAFSKQTVPAEVAAEVTRALRDMKRDGTFERIRMRYLGK